MKKIVYISVISLFIMCSCKNNELSKAEYSGQDVSKYGSILRDKDSKEASFAMSYRGEWKLYAGPSVDKINFSKVFANGVGKDIFPLITKNDTTRLYFQLVTPDGNAILSDSHLPMSGGYNYRDLGGLKNEEGKFLKWGKLFRSDEMKNLTTADLKYLASIPIVSVVDFRSEEEIVAAPDKFPSSVKNGYKLSISPGNLTLDYNLENMKTDEAVNFMIDMNKAFVTDTAIINEYRTFFELVQNEDNLPLLFHCTAGKDRTGLANTLILYSLGFDDETIMKEYLLSNVYLDKKYESIKSTMPNMEPLLSVRPEYLQAAIDQINKEYGSVENYLTKVLNVDLQKMKQLYLY